MEETVFCSSKSFLLLGETIFIEKPLLSIQFSWNQIYGYKCCHHCLEPLETANENAVRLANDPNIVLPYEDCCATRKSFHVKCPNCDAIFCSQSCLEEAFNTYHKVLCHVDPNHPYKGIKHPKDFVRFTFHTKLFFV